MREHIIIIIIIVITIMSRVDSHSPSLILLDDDAAAAAAASTYSVILIIISALGFSDCWLLTCSFSVFYSCFVLFCFVVLGSPLHLYTTSTHSSTVCPSIHWREILSEQASTLRSQYSLTD
eukprot:GHVU01032394.1.p1 GENE.GHVU01032394.1~~GHVU01032394.1.p1  ORF type:complete len:121 (-),score=7.76 GHVU01032394.1:75-437(-)